MREDIGDPETLSFVEFARQFQEATGIHRPILPMRISARTAQKFGLAEARGRRGSKTWSSRLSASTG